MPNDLIVAIIGGIFTLSGIIITQVCSNKRFSRDMNAKNTETLNAVKFELEKNQAVTNEKITELTREVREHNNFARRMPVVEEQIKQLQEEVKNIQEDIKR